MPDIQAENSVLLCEGQVFVKKVSVNLLDTSASISVTQMKNWINMIL